MPLVYFKNEQNVFICPKCKFSTEHQNTMHYHLKKHQGVYDHECPHCDKKFMNKQNLDLHIAAKHEETERSFECAHKGCAFKALTQGNCRIHWMRMHCKEKCKEILSQKDSGYSCNRCSKDFKGLTSFYYHAYECLELKESFLKA